ncbi:hypothetical protein LINPERPRIM_LOCUS21845 [Linum perenne]
MLIRFDFKGSVPRVRRGCWCTITCQIVPSIIICSRAARF